MSEDLFNEQDYLERYPDVAGAIESGDLLSARQHYVLFGKNEGRHPYRFDPRWYAETYPAAQADVDAGKALTLKRHYETIGRSKNWLPHAPAQSDMTAIKIAGFDSPLRPILLTFAPRSGSTLLMHTMADHANVAVAKHYPYEVRVAAYYAHAARVLTTKGNHQSGTPTEFMRKFVSLSYNPFYHPDFDDVFATDGLGAGFFGSYATTATYEFCRRMADHYYKLVAIDQGKPQARYFAEKCELDYRLRAIFRQMCPDSKEIILVRDLRDMYVSYRQYFSATMEEAIPIVGNAGRMLMSIKKMDCSDNIMFIRYEDCIHDMADVLLKLGCFLDLAFASTDTDRGVLFAKHGTSRSPEASIGRWKTDLNDEVMTFSNAEGIKLQEFNEIFGYPP